MSRIKFGEIIKAEKFKSGTAKNGKEYKMFVIGEGSTKITVFLDNVDAMIAEGDMVEIKEIKDVSVKKNKVGNSFYMNVVVTAKVEKVSSAENPFDFDNDSDYDMPDADDGMPWSM